MNTINVSIPQQLKEDALDLVKQGHYTSLNNLIRKALQTVVKQYRHSQWIKEAKDDLESGKAKVLRSSTDITQFMKDL